MDRLCQLASNLLDRNSRQQTFVASPSPVASIVINRIRTGNHIRVHRRRRRRTFPFRPVVSSSTRTVSPHQSSETNLTQPSPLVTDQSRESLINLYCLFQDNLNSSKTDLV